MVVEQMARCAWNARPDERGLGGRMAWNPQRVDAIIKSIVEDRTERTHLPDADFAALLCGIDLEQQQAGSVQQTS